MSSRARGDLLFWVFIAALFAVAVWLSQVRGAPLPARLPVPEPTPQPVPEMKRVPWSGDLERFPDIGTTRDAVAWADRHRAWLECQRSLDLVYPEFWSAWLHDADAASMPWRLLLAAQTRSWDGVGVVWDRRGKAEAIDLLAEVLGAERYATGDMPPVTPLVRRFRRGE
jgi:hypothetical protein